MSIRSRLVPYALRVMRGEVRPGQLVNLARSRLLPKGEVISWQPTHLSIFTTNRCNFRCDMCPTHSRKVPENYLHRHGDAPDMTLDILRLVLERYSKAIRLQLIGTGEPLLNSQLWEMAREGARRKMVVETISNGYVLDEYIPELVRSDFDRICISINGHNDEEFQRITGNPSKHYTKILFNVEALVQKRNIKRSPLKIEVSFILDRYNYHYMREMIGVGEKLGADRVILNNFLPSPYAGLTPEEKCLYEDETIREEFRRAASERLRCKVIWPFLLGKTQSARKICNMPFNTLQVDGDGNVGGCSVMLLNMKGNGSIWDKDPWNNSFFRDLRKRHLEGNLLWPCRYCCGSIGVTVF